MKFADHRQKPSNAAASSPLESCVLSGVVIFMPFFFIILMPLLAVFCVCYDVIRLGSSTWHLFERYTPEVVSELPVPDNVVPVGSWSMAYDEMVRAAHKEAV